VGGVWLMSDQQQEQLWDAGAPLTGFHAALGP
jgi:hypothetical protein